MWLPVLCETFLRTYVRALFVHSCVLVLVILSKFEMPPTAVEEAGYT